MFFETSNLKDEEIYLSLYKTAEENREKRYVSAYYFHMVRLADNVKVGKWIYNMFTREHCI